MVGVAEVKRGVTGPGPGLSSEGNGDSAALSVWTDMTRLPF